MLIVSNWKAYVQSQKKAKELFNAAKKAASLSKGGSVSIVLAPPAPYLGLFSTGATKVAFAAQNISSSSGGAATGEVTAELLADLGVTYSIVGHSELRAKGETDEMVMEKVRMALAHNITPIVCVGERERDPEAQYLAFLRAQIRAVYEPLAPKQRSQVILAYEPIWAIGKTASEAITQHDLTEMILYIRKVLGDYLPARAPEKAILLYGGSVEAAGAASLSEGTGINGFLLGHASADPLQFTQIVKAVQKK
jgi:triosephosphate isomerase